MIPALDRGVRWALAHWLLVVNVLVALYGGLPWLAALLHATGFDRAGDILFRLYGPPICHQLPDRSFFLMGEQVAFCQREAAMYTSLLLGGLIFSGLRDRLTAGPLWAGALLLLPMVIDGGSHLVHQVLPGLNLRPGPHDIGSFNFWARMVTGVLFAVAVVWCVYPRLERDLRRAQLV